MWKNVGSLDRTLRIVLALGAVIWALGASGALAVVLWIVAALLVVTGLTGFCPLYRAFRMSTRSE